MTPKVRVLNLNTHPLHEMFKGDEVLIAAQDYWRDQKGNIKEIDIFEANDFRGQYRPVPFDGSGKMLNDPKYFKMIKLEPVGKGTTGADSFEDEEAITHNHFKCMAKDCKHASPSPEELEAHIKVRHPSAERLVMPEVDQEIKKRGRPKKDVA